MPTPDNLPIYWATLDEDVHGLSFVSLVDRPGIERDFIALSAEKRPSVCAVASEDKRLVHGPLLRADFPIYRKDEYGEYYIVFSADTIRQAVEKWFADKQVGLVNIMHEAGTQVDGVRLVQLFIKNQAAGLDPAGFEDIEEGSLFAEYHVTDEALWAAIKAGEFRGFSIEGNFSFSPKNQLLKSKNAAMSKIGKLKAALAAVLQALSTTLGAATTDKGALFWDGDHDLKAGDAVYIEDEGGERKPAPDGDYKTEDGKTIKVASGKVAEIVDPKAEVAAKDGDTPPPDGEGGKAADGAGKDPERLDQIEERLDKLEDLIEKIVEGLDKTNVQLRALKKAPAAEPARVTFHEGGADAKTGNREADRLSALLQ